MLRRRPMVIGCLIIVLAVWGSIGIQGVGADSTTKNQKRKISIELTEEFYRALRNEDTRTYTTEKKDEYLRQIAVSTKFMVETNLRIIEQQARMIELLEKNSVKP